MSAPFDSGTEQLQVAVVDRVAVITLNRPEARNALSPELSAGLRKAIAWAADSDTVGALLLTGAGKAFCSGGDVKAMGTRPSADAPKPTFESQFQDLSLRHHGIGGALRSLSKPSIAALPGAAAGAGMAIALACDLRVAASSAFLSTAYAKIGLSGDYGIAWLLTRTVGPGRARALMLTAERVHAAEALQMGLVNQVTEPDALMETALALAKELANGPSTAYRYIKDNLDEALSIDHATAIDREADRLLKARTTNDHREAVKAFAEKRKPTFSGK
ncbi:MAG: enoyl-CoA hydratase-related protein [Pseudomonadales bacterium]